MDYRCNIKISESSYCHDTAPSVAKLAKHIRDQHGYSAKQAKARALETAEYQDKHYQEDSLTALGFQKCPRCHQYADGRLFAIVAQDEYLPDKPVCSDCQPFRVLEGIGMIRRDSINSGWAYQRHDSKHESCGYRSVEEAERRLRHHVADLENRLDIVLNPEDRRELLRMWIWRNRIMRVMKLHDDNRNVADAILGGMQSCNEHHFCRTFRNAA